MRRLLGVGCLLARSVNRHGRTPFIAQPSSQVCKAIGQAAQLLDLLVHLSRAPVDHRQQLLRARRTAVLEAGTGQRPDLAERHVQAAQGQNELMRRTSSSPYSR